MEKKDLSYILVGFAVSYIFFGLEEVMIDYSIVIKKIIGVFAILLGFVFILLAINYSRKKV